MDHQNPAEMIGPEFLQKLSEQQLAAGLETDFITLQANSKAWQAERAATMDLQHVIDQQERSLRSMSEQLQQLSAKASAAVQVCQ